MNSYRHNLPTCLFMAALPILLCLCGITSCAQNILGLNRSTRMIIYGDMLDVAGHPEIGEPLKALARTLDKQPTTITP